MANDYFDYHSTLLESQAYQKQIKSIWKAIQDTINNYMSETISSYGGSRLYDIKTLKVKTKPDAYEGYSAFKVYYKHEFSQYRLVLLITIDFIDSATQGEAPVTLSLYAEDAKTTKVTHKIAFVKSSLDIQKGNPSKLDPRAVNFILYDITNKAEMKTFAFSLIKEFVTRKVEEDIHGSAYSALVSEFDLTLYREDVLGKNLSYSFKMPITPFDYSVYNSYDSWYEYEVAPLIQEMTDFIKSKGFRDSDFGIHFSEKNFASLVFYNAVV